MRIVEYARTKGFLFPSKSDKHCQHSCSYGLEVAADNGHTEVVQQIIALHKSIIRNASQEVSNGSESPLASIEHVARVSPKDAAEMIAEYTASGGRIDRNSAEQILKGAASADIDRLFEVLEESNPAVRETLDIREHKSLQSLESVLRRYSQSSNEAAQTSDKNDYDKLDKDSPEFRDYGHLRAYTTAIKKFDTAEFKRSVLDHFKTSASFTKTAMEGGKGHTIFTAVASLGTPEQMDMLLNAYRKKAGILENKAVSNSSSLGSPLQCAIVANNLTMSKCLIEKVGTQEINKHSNERSENLLHTIASSFAPFASDLFSFFPRAGKNLSSISIVKALFHENVVGKTPLDMAIESGEERTSSLLSFVGNALDKENIERLIASTDLTEKAISLGSSSALKWVFDTAERYNFKVGKKNSLLVLGSRNYTYSLFDLACKNGNADIVRLLHWKVNEKQKWKCRHRTPSSLEGE
ncbi:ankyrin repeat-containing protein [Anaplasma platys]|uniref:Ankyrin repeat-containing protein n=2 Tax=Anaplasma platys TaxID=949 RepID=A0A858PYK1_9RICK|nr:ankyrin repeat-containing protein [Anaplasma platys]